MLKFYTTQDGLVKVDFTDIMGQKCSFQESNNTTYRAVFFGVDFDENGKPVKEWMHLNTDMAREIHEKFLDVLEGVEKPIDVVFKDAFKQKCIIKKNDDTMILGVDICIDGKKVEKFMHFSKYLLIEIAPIIERFVNFKPLINQ